MITKSKLGNSSVTMYLSGRELATLRKTLGSKGLAPLHDALRSDDPGPGAFISNILSRASARGVEAEMRTFLREQRLLCCFARDGEECAEPRSAY